MTTEIGSRLASERKRLGLTQVKLAEIGGVAVSAQSRYEVGKTVPDANYLHAFDKEGGDVLYVISGQRSSATPISEVLLRALINRVFHLDRKYRDWNIQADSMIVAMYGRIIVHVEPGDDVNQLVDREMEYVVALLEEAHANKKDSDAGQDISVSGDDNRVAGRDYVEKKGE